jgi:hypothetical protein
MWCRVPVRCVAHGSDSIPLLYCTMVIRYAHGSDSIPLLYCTMVIRYISNIKAKDICETTSLEIQNSSPDPVGGARA